jgi:squalene-hopene cyclase-like protein/prenyltransferase/squalene oxidase-like repeat protein
MKAVVGSVFALATLGLLGSSTTVKTDDVAWTATGRGVQWLVSVQGKDGGWGQDGGETSYVRNGERLESRGNDVANTAVSVLALMRAGNTPVRGPHRVAVARGIEFLLKNVEQSPEQGLAVTNVTDSQIQRKLGPFIDTFLASMALAEADGNMPDAASNGRAHRCLEKVVSKIEKNQLKDGSWNVAGGWAPILGTSLASRGLYAAQQKGAKVDQAVMARMDDYTKKNTGSSGGVAGAVPGGVASGVVGGVAAGVPLYASAQALEQLSRTSADREKNAKQISAIRAELSSARFVSGFGSMGGEEFFSYLNISDSLKRNGGAEWNKWNTDIKTKLVRLQNDDGTWAGHHCITGRVAVTSAAILTLLSDREQVLTTRK